MWVIKNKNPRLKIVIFLTLCFGVLPFTEAVYAHEAGWYTQIDYTSRLPAYAAYGTTIMLPYNGAFAPSKIGTYLDAAQAQNIKVWVDLRIEVLKPSESDWKTIINTYKSHPALKGWYISDEPEWGGTSAALLEQYYTWTKEADPNHLVAIAHAWRASAQYVNGYDVFMVDVYPGWGYGAPDYNEFCYRVRESYKWWNDAISFAATYNKEEFYAVALGFGVRGGNGVRDLSYAEYRYHSLIPIVLGADGVLFWMDEWADKEAQSLRDNIEAMISQIHAIDDEMENGITNDPQLTLSQPTSKIIYRYGSNGTSHVILAINISRWDAADNNGETLANVQFTLPGGIQTSQVEVLDEARTLPVVNGVFIDGFNRFEVHTYRFTAETGSSIPPAPPSGLRLMGTKLP